MRNSIYGRWRYKIILLQRDRIKWTYPCMYTYYVFFDVLRRRTRTSPDQHFTSASNSSSSKPDPDAADPWPNQKQTFSNTLDIFSPGRHPPNKGIEQPLQVPAALQAPLQGTNIIGFVVLSCFALIRSAGPYCLIAHAVADSVSQHPPLASALFYLSETVGNTSSLNLRYFPQSKCHRNRCLTLPFGGS